jgi:AraC-like DNA-binding protein
LKISDVRYVQRVSAYREFAPSPPLHALLACRWLREPEDASADSTLILPDGCVDLIWRDGELALAGLDSAARWSPVRPGTPIAGIRLRPGVAGAVFGLPASELLDVQVPLEELIGPSAARFSERLAAAPGHDAEHLLLEGLVAAALADRSPDPLVLAATRRLGFPGSRVDELAYALGISERQLRRRFHAAVGYGPKTLDRVLRFRRLVSQAQAVSEGEVDLARLAADLGYADQAHMSRDSVRLTGMPPARLAALWAS